MNGRFQETRGNRLTVSIPTSVIEMGLYIGAIHPEDLTIEGHDTNITIISTTRPNFFNGRRVYAREDVFHEFMRRVHIYMNRDPKQKRNVLGNITSFTINAENKYRTA
uniref:Helitron_like_N domain-containing protein n=1 Tax=Strongyloides papillosus TaxID=174720 RepID=A0A0N5C5M4_STREA